MSSKLRKNISGKKINVSSLRAAMGFNENYQATQLEICNTTFEEQRFYSKEKLIEIIEHSSSSLEQRWCAGQILGLIGDPRIKIFDPKMIDIIGCQAKVGLEPTRLTPTFNALADTGVLPEWIEKEVPAHFVTIKSYRLAKYPVSNSEYLVFLKETAGEIPTSWPWGRYPQERANHPVHTLTHMMAEAYVTWLARKTGRPFRLPKEVEWEYAAAGKNGTEFPWGQTFEKTNANTVESAILSTTPVGIFPQGDSCFGISDMAGNVEEYVQEDYQPYPGGKMIKDDLTQNGEKYRVARGGSFTRFRDLARCRRRHGKYPSPLYVMGLRLAEDV